jgi:hypothetical protein
MADELTFEQWQAQQYQAYLDKLKATREPIPPPEPVDPLEVLYKSRLPNSAKAEVLAHVDAIAPDQLPKFVAHLERLTAKFPGDDWFGKEMAYAELRYPSGDMRSVVVNPIVDPPSSSTPPAPAVEQPKPEPPDPTAGLTPFQKQQYEYMRQKPVSGLGVNAIGQRESLTPLSAPQGLMQAPDNGVPPEIQAQLDQPQFRNAWGIRPPGQKRVMAYGAEQAFDLARAIAPPVDPTDFSGMNARFTQQANLRSWTSEQNFMKPQKGKPDGQ